MGKNANAAMQKKYRPGIVERVVADPYYDPSIAESGKNPSERRVEFNTRESSIATMHARKQIDDKQKVAADRFRALYERAGYVGAQALDYSQEVVDGGPAPSDGLYQSKVDAVRELTKISGELGQIGYAVLIHVCGMGCTIAQVTAIMVRKRPNKREKEYYGMLFRDHINLLCEFWGYSKRQT